MRKAHKGGGLNPSFIGTGSLTFEKQLDKDDKLSLNPSFIGTGSLTKMKIKDLNRVQSCLNPSFIGTGSLTSGSLHP